MSHMQSQIAEVTHLTRGGRRQSIRRERVFIAEAYQHDLCEKFSKKMVASSHSCIHLLLGLFASL